MSTELSTSVRCICWVCAASALCVCWVDDNLETHSPTVDLGIEHRFCLQFSAAVLILKREQSCRSRAGTALYGDMIAGAISGQICEGTCGVIAAQGFSV